MKSDSFTFQTKKILCKFIVQQIKGRGCGLTTFTCKKQNKSNKLLPQINEIYEQEKNQKAYYQN